jgi:beta-galactosidase
VELLKSGPVLNAWRAPTSNETERDWGRPPIADQWRKAGLDRLKNRVVHVSVEEKTAVPIPEPGSSGAVKVMVRTIAQAPECESGFENDFTYTFLGTGELWIEHRVKPFGPMPEYLPKIGMQMTLADPFQNFTWYGRGPFETYPDRKTGAKINIHAGTVDGQFTPYLVPQDFGNKTDVRWAALTNPDGIGLLASGDDLLNVSAHHFSTDHLTRALYPFRLKKQEGVVLNLDHRVCGLGETPIRTQPKYRVLAREYRYRIRLAPFDARQIKAVEKWRR